VVLQNISFSVIGGFNNRKHFEDSFIMPMPMHGVLQARNDGFFF
jgi:hypothetical protein